MTNMPEVVELFDDRPSENGDSTSSELERLDHNASPCQSSSDTPTERGIAKSKKQEDTIFRIIEETRALGTNTLDLSQKGMRMLPSEILDMPQLEYLYLEGNELTVIPDELFDKLPNLKWLDLRRNYLVRLPSVYTGQHKNIRNLLLESNNLRTLPLELGLIKSLHGLNISNNPLEFPPQHVIQKGTSDILKFLREMIQAKSAGKLLNGKKTQRVIKRQQSCPVSVSGNTQNFETVQPSQSVDFCRRVKTGLRRTSANANINMHSAHLVSQQFPIEEEANESDLSLKSHDAPKAECPNLECDDSSSSDDDWEIDDGNLRQYAYNQVQERINSTEVAKKESSGQIVPMNKSAELHRPVSYTALKKNKRENLLKASVLGKIAKKPQSATSVLNWKVNPYPEPPPLDYVAQRTLEAKEKTKEKECNEKTDAVLQRRKDEELLKNWRTESKRLQQKKYFESLKKGTKDFLDPVLQAPYDIDPNHMRIPSNEERIKADVKSAHEKIRRQISPASRQRIEEEKAQRILQLEKRIKAHTSQMQERRKKPKGTPQEEMEAARKELEVVENMYQEVKTHRKSMEYNLQAYIPNLSYK